MAAAFVTSAHSAHIPAGFIGWEAGPGMQAIFEAARKSDEYQMHCGAEVDPDVARHRSLLELDATMLLNPKVGIAPDAREELAQINARLMKLRAAPMNDLPCTMLHTVAGFLPANAVAAAPLISQGVGEGMGSDEV